MYGRQPLYLLMKFTVLIKPSKMLIPALKVNNNTNRATTENPYFSINSALLSRSLIFELNTLTEENILQLLKRDQG